jgi:hypothetical protein
MSKFDEAEFPNKFDEAEFQKLQKWLYHHCRESGVDFDRLEEFNSKFFSLGQNMTREQIRELCVQIQPKFWRCLVDSLDFYEMSQKSTEKLSSRQKSLFQLFYYLVMTEGTVSGYVDVIAFLLMQDGHDIYDARRMEFVDDYKELDKVDLYVKLQFLEKHGFNLLTDAIDRELRNCIAHLDFTVYDDGSVINERTGKTIEIEKKISYLHSITCVTANAFIQLLDIVAPRGTT